ncbi:MAG: hypothetical protein ABIO70_21865 [Pseudomonadota bacterium]
MHQFARWLRYSLAILALTVGWVASSVLLADPVQAQAVFDAAGLVELIPAGEVVGDGKTAVKFSLIALQADGTPMAALKAKVVPTGGSVTPLREIGGGVYDFSFTPPEVNAPRQIELAIKGKSAAGVAVGKVYGVTVTPPPSHRITVTANPPEIILGQDASSTVNIQIAAAPGEDLSGVALEVGATAGTIANLTPLGGGRYSALYTPPKVNYPHIAMITVADRQDPGRSYGYISMPLVGKTSYPITTTPGANVMLRVGTRDFGPIQADASGRANVPIVVPPGVSLAVLTTASGTETKTENIDLKVPDNKRIALLPTVAGIPGDKSVTIPVRVAVVAPTGEPAANAMVSISASSGTITKPVHEGNGIYRADFTPSTSLVMGQVNLAASLDGQAATHSDAASIPLIPVRPAGVTLSTEPALLPAAATGFKALVQVVGPGGAGLSDRQVLLEANGAKLRESVKDLKAGDYQGLFDLTGNGPVELTATVLSASTGNPLRSLVVLPSVSRLPNDGMSSAMLTVVAVDEFGYPVAGVPLAAKVVAGDGQIPAAATTNEAGVAQLYYQAGRGTGLVNIQFTAGAATGAVAILQAPATAASTLVLPRSGTETSLAQRDAWAAIVQFKRVEREGQAAVVLPPPAAPVGGGELASMALSAEPAGAAPGGKVTVKIAARSAQGSGVTGLGFDHMVSAGTLSAWTDLGTGEYTATLTVPAGLAGEIMLSVQDKNGKASGFLKVPITAAPASIWGAPEPTPAPVAQPVPEPQPVAQPEPQPFGTPAPQPEPPKPAGDHRWVRVRAALGTAGYHYNYDVNATPYEFDADGQPLPYAHSLQLSGDTAAQEGTGDVVPLSVPTVDVRLLAWLPMFEYVGVDARYRTTWFGVETDSFTRTHEGVDMTWTDSFFTATLQGRYFYDAGENRFWIGVQGGVASTAVPVVAMWTPPDQDRGLWFYPWGLTSLYGGIRGGADLGFGLDVLLSGAWGTETYSGVFTSDVDLELAYEVIDHVTVNLGYNRLSRDVIIPERTVECGDDCGNMVEITDLRSGVYLGVGTAF